MSEEGHTGELVVRRGKSRLLPVEEQNVKNWGLEKRDLQLSVRKEDILVELSPITINDRKELALCWVDNVMKKPTRRFCSFS